MNQDPNEYYVIFENWRLDPNQWSMLIDSIAVMLTLVGLLFAFLLYRKQRKDNAKDAFDFFQSSLPELRQSIQVTIENLKKFIQNMDADKFVHPMLSPTLNDKFLTKINLVDLNRFYKKHKRDSHSIFRNFLVHSNFFGDYHSYFTQEIDAFGTYYLEKERIFQRWKLLRSAPFYSSDAENSDFQDLFILWTKALNQDKALFDFNDQGWPTEVKDRKKLVENHIQQLAQDTFAFVPFSEKANEVNRIANKAVTAYADMSEMKANIKAVLEKDIRKFGQVLVNLNGLMEESSIEQPKS